MTDPIPTPPKKPLLERILTKLNESRKAGAALAIGALGWGQDVVRSESIPVTGQEWINLGFAILAALGVYAVANKK